LGKVWATFRPKLTLESLIQEEQKLMEEQEHPTMHYLKPNQEEVHLIKKRLARWIRQQHVGAVFYSNVGREEVIAFLLHYLEGQPAVIARIDFMAKTISFQR
jgi:hypothetical protein